MQPVQHSPAFGRLMLGAVGALAGLCLWLLVDVLPDRMQDSPRFFLFLVGFYGTFFIALLALIGPLTLPRAAGAAAGQALIVALLVLWASTRFGDVKAFVETPHPWAAAGILTLIPLPFAISRAREGRWFDYPALFAHSWDIVVRYAAAWVFVGVVWGVVMLSDALFQLVGIEIIKHLLEIEVVPFLLTGIALGVALAVVNELSDYVSPYLVLRLLRLLLPVVLAVVAVFLAALPFRGLSHLFGSFSAATTLMAMAMGATTLITTALDADDARAVDSPVMRVVAQLMALVLPALGVLAGVAIWMRVNQYGWSPDRLAAATLAALVLGYGLTYAVAVLLRHDWGGRIRRANIVLALVALAVAALWLTPAFNPQRIATASQIARFQSGRTEAAKLDLWTMARDWGRPGQAGLARLAAMTDHPQAEEMAARLEKLAGATTRTGFDQVEVDQGRAALLAQLLADLPVLPAGAVLPQGLFDDFRTWELTDLLAACARRTPADNPGCALLLAELSGRNAGDEPVLAQLTAYDGLQIAALFGDSARGYERRYPTFLKGGQLATGGGTALDSLFTGAFTFVPLQTQALTLNGRLLFFGP
ncbi:DUF4153 domain-containing protein [Actibacterium sp. D379-3]